MRRKICGGDIVVISIEVDQQRISCSGNKDIDTTVFDNEIIQISNKEKIVSGGIDQKR